MMKFEKFSNSGYKKRRPSRPYTAAICLLFFLSYLNSAISQTLPKWEVGLGIGGINVPHYRGSRDNHTYVIPYPYMIYRGEKVKMDKQGITGWLLKTEKLKVDISLAAGIPVPSDPDGTRASMPELDPTLEIGPALHVKLWQHDHEYQSLWLSLPIRSAYSIDSLNIEHQGWVFTPAAIFNITRQHEHYWQANISLGPLYGDAQYHHYFYGVDKQYATPNRNPYRGKAGYAGVRASISLIIRNKARMISLYWRRDSLKNSVFSSSNLVKTNDYQIIGLSYTWFLVKSSAITKAQ